MVEIPHSEEFRYVETVKDEIKSFLKEDAEVFISDTPQNPFSWV